MVSRPPERFSIRLQADPRSERHVSPASASSALVKKNELLQIIGVEGKGRFEYSKRVFYFFLFFYEETFCLCFLFVFFVYVSSSFLFLLFFENARIVFLIFFMNVLLFCFCFFIYILLFTYITPKDFNFFFF